MRIIIDSHIFLHMIREPERLSPAQREAVKDRANDVLLSHASVWEMLIKSRIGKLVLPDSPEVVFGTLMDTMRVRLLPITMAHILRTHDLPLHHKDPFDRIIVAQAQVETLPVVSSDRFLPAYDIQVIV
jgi:PIN domain nuclease of toxin-antitoxin system